MKNHPPHPPSTYVTMRVAYGNENKHLYRFDEYEGPDFHPDRLTAEKAARAAIEEDPNIVIAMLKVEELIAAKIEVQVVSVNDGK